LAALPSAQDGANYRIPKKDLVSIWMKSVPCRSPRQRPIAIRHRLKSFLSLHRFPYILHASPKENFFTGC